MSDFPFHPFQTFISIFCNAEMIHLWNVMMGGGREISAAQDRLTELLQWMYRDQPENREIICLIMSTVGRGGEGDVGQRIRDEILVIQVTAQKAKLMVFRHRIEAFVAVLLHGVKFSYCKFIDCSATMIVRVEWWKSGIRSFTIIQVQMMLLFVRYILYVWYVTSSAQM